MRSYRDQTSWSNDQGSLDGGTPPIHALFMKCPKPKINKYKRNRKNTALIEKFLSVCRKMKVTFTQINPPTITQKCIEGFFQVPCHL